MESIFVVIVFVLIGIVSASQKKAQEEARRRRGGSMPAGQQPEYRKPAPPKAKQPESRPDAGRVMQNVDRRVRTKERNGPGRAFERNAGRRDRDFTESSNAADVKYTAQGCGCDARGNTAAGRSHGVSNAIYDEARYFEEAQEMRGGRWT